MLCPWVLCTLSETFYWFVCYWNPEAAVCANCSTMFHTRISWGNHMLNESNNITHNTTAKKSKNTTFVRLLYLKYIWCVWFIVNRYNHIICSSKTANIKLTFVFMLELSATYSYLNLCKVLLFVILETHIFSVQWVIFLKRASGKREKYQVLWPFCYYNYH